jgi:hypothetical protein
MSLWFKSPMAGKYQAFFLVYTLLIMGLFGLVGVLIGKFMYGTAVAVLLADVLLVGIGFMIRKRVLRGMGIVKPGKEE